MRITDTLFIDESELEERHIRASGPGGQHVNKASTAIQLRFDAMASPSLPDAVKARLRRLAGSRMTKDGVIVIEAGNARSQERNRQDARERLATLVERATHAPKPRKASRPSLSSIRKQKAAKAQQGRKKALRQAPKVED
ncbi:MULTISPECIES: alternative ribosome rescue aminoacyl-tRNA hydrolase ArfB [Hyphobacterium]|uniref:Alternative ribosome rescue aminoacyl-tRNA hydrolase ArfB n=1 Tax=Hyphobacterium vulgare TaxID=1736751 RepID=A0ABV7A0P5_9PROT